MGLTDRLSLHSPLLSNRPSTLWHFYELCRLLHRACAAFRAFSLRCSSVSLSAEALPPLRPSCTAAGFFFLTMRYEHSIIVRC
jgi:hypothetical protein